MGRQSHKTALRPYKTHYLVEATKPINSKDRGVLFAQLKELIDFGIEETSDRCKVLTTNEPLFLRDGTHIGWIIYRRTYPVTWDSDADALRNTDRASSSRQTPFQKAKFAEKLMFTSVRDS
jgi:hypothetical protein